MFRLLIIISLFFTFAEAKKVKKVDYINLAAILIKDGYYKRAKSALDKVDIEKKKFDFVQYYTLKGVVYNNLSYPLISNIFFNESIKRGQKNRAIYLQMARNYWKLKDYPNTIKYINIAKEEAKKDPVNFAILAEAYKREDNYESAWIALDEALEIFEDKSRFYRQKFYYLAELEFYETAIVYAKKFLESKNKKVKDYIAIALTLREKKLYDEAAVLVEEALLTTKRDHEEYDKLVELLAQIYIDKKEYISAASVYDKASIYKPEFAHKAAALYLKGSQGVRSLQLNRRVIDQKEKFRQRVEIDLFFEDYESLVSTEESLKRYGLLKDENIKYALGYGYFRTRDFESSKNHLTGINSKSLFEKSSYILQKIDVCNEKPLECEI